MLNGGDGRGDMWMGITGAMRWGCTVVLLLLRVGVVGLRSRLLGLGDALGPRSQVRLRDL